MEDLYNLPKEVWQKMTREEQMNYVCLSLMGSHLYDAQGNVTILSGKTKFDKLKEMRNALLAKYTQLPLL